MINFIYYPPAKVPHGYIYVFVSDFLSELKTLNLGGRETQPKVNDHSRNYIERVPVKVTSRNERVT